jgi:DNA-binding CsgD family transcriptional regulator
MNDELALSDQVSADGRIPPQLGCGDCDSQTPRDRNIRKEPIFRGLTPAGHEKSAIHGSGLGCSQARLHALKHDAEHGMPFPLAELWPRLRAGHWRLGDAFADANRWYVLVEATPLGSGVEPRSRSGLAMLEDVLLGQTSKVVAIERNLSPSAVAYAMRTVLDSIGLDCRLRGVPQILMLSARLSKTSNSQAPAARIARVSGSRFQTWVISTRCPKLDLLDSLSPAERAVMLQVLDGCDYKHIASTRKVSLRTVANQVTMSFRKLGVSGRAELVDRVLQHSLGADTNQASPSLRSAPTRRAARRFARQLPRVAVAASAAG